MTRYLLLSLQVSCRLTHVDLKSIFGQLTWTDLAGLLGVFGEFSWNETAQPQQLWSVASSVSRLVFTSSEGKLHSSVVTQHRQNVTSVYASGFPSYSLFIWRICSDYTVSKFTLARVVFGAFVGPSLPEDAQWWCVKTSSSSSSSEADRLDWSVAALSCLFFVLNFISLNN